jgi:hypothetical protein
MWSRACSVIGARVRVIQTRSFFVRKEGAILPLTFLSLIPMPLKYIRHLNERFHAIPTELILHELAYMLMQAYSSYVLANANEAFH